MSAELKAHGMADRTADRDRLPSRPRSSFHRSMSFAYLEVLAHLDADGAREAQLVGARRGPR